MNFRSIKKWLKNFCSKKKAPAKALVLIDFENLLLALETESDKILLEEKTPTLTERLNELTKRIAREVAEVVAVFVFIPRFSTMWSKEFHKSGFFMIYCPKILNKESQEVDTVDETMIQFGQLMIQQIPDLTHLCIASGDQDFIPLIRQAIQKGLKTIVVPGSNRSLSLELKRVADRTWFFS